MADISTLIDDMYAVLQDQEPRGEVATCFDSILNSRLQGGNNEGRRFRLSSVADLCERRIWYQANYPDLAEQVGRETQLMFLYGDLIEDMALSLAEAAGHDVTGRQDKMYIGDIVGHRDAVIDGYLIDVKSASSRTYFKFVKGIDPDDDLFGYLGQLKNYLIASRDDDEVEHKNKAAFLAVEKSFGGMTLDWYEWSDKELDEHRDMVLERVNRCSDEELNPQRSFTDVPMGQSGNRALHTKCKYCEFKKSCWPGLRSFAYSKGVEHLTKVVRQPEVLEINA